MTRIFTGWGPLPAVVATRDQTGGWNAAGQTRTVHLSDGSQAQEQLTGYAAPHSFTYTVTPNTGVLSLLISNAEGKWWFFPLPGGGTEIWWRYELRPRTPWRWPVLLLVAVLWEQYMERALTLLVTEIER
ncbi:SRPBCC family protein [Deinococcus cavernae]|nr:SRPBCC family protein [Deinococcus cavernae]